MTTRGFLSIVYDATNTHRGTYFWHKQRFEKLLMERPNFEKTNFMPDVPVELMLRIADMVASGEDCCIDDMVKTHPFFFRWACEERNLVINPHQVISSCIQFKMIGTDITCNIPRTWTHAIRNLKNVTVEIDANVQYLASTHAFALVVLPCFDRLETLCVEDNERYCSVKFDGKEALAEWRSHGCPGFPCDFHLPNVFEEVMKSAPRAIVGIDMSDSSCNIPSCASLANMTRLTSLTFSKNHIIRNVFEMERLMNVIGTHMSHLKSLRLPAFVSSGFGETAKEPQVWACASHLTHLHLDIRRGSNTSLAFLTRVVDGFSNIIHLVLDGGRKTIEEQYEAQRATRTKHHKLHDVLDCFSIRTLGTVETLDIRNIVGWCATNVMYIMSNKMAKLRVLTMDNCTKHCVHFVTSFPPSLKHINGMCAQSAEAVRDLLCSFRTDKLPEDLSVKVSIQPEIPLVLDVVGNGASADLMHSITNNDLLGNCGIQPMLDIRTPAVFMHDIDVLNPRMCQMSRFCMDSLSQLVRFLQWRTIKGGEPMTHMGGIDINLNGMPFMDANTIYTYPFVLPGHNDRTKYHGSIEDEYDEHNEDLYIMDGRTSNVVQELYMWMTSSCEVIRTRPHIKVLYLTLWKNITWEKEVVPVILKMMSDTDGAAGLERVHLRWPNKSDFRICYQQTFDVILEDKEEYRLREVEDLIW